MDGKGGEAKFSYLSPGILDAKNRKERYMFIKYLRQLNDSHRLSGMLILPIYRKTGSRVLGYEAFEIARDIQLVMDKLPELLDVAEQAETYLDWLRDSGIEGLGIAPLAAAVTRLNSVQVPGLAS